jgi:hypothetical protein
MPKRDIQFLHCGRPPYIRELVSYTCDGSEGIIEFDGYYRLNDGTDEMHASCKSLPAREIFFAQLHSDTPRYVTRTRQPWQPLELDPAHSSKEEITYLTYDLLEQDVYIVEVYKREIIECTDQISTIEDEDGEPMRVCFTPTDRQRIYFRVLEVNPTNERIDEVQRVIEKEEKDRMNQYYAEQRASYRGVTIDRQAQ